LNLYSIYLFIEFIQVPAQFTGGYEKYANDICWIMNTYYVPMEHDIPHSETTRYERKKDFFFIYLFDRENLIFKEC
jgi:hypothetical protein